MNIYRFELKQLRGSMIGWTVAVCCFVAVYLGMYPLFATSGFVVAEMFSRFPETLQSLYGMTNLDLSTITGFLPFPMKLVEELLAVGGLMLGIRSAAHDTREHCADFLYAKPVSRRRIFLAKAGSIFTMGAELFLATALFTGGAAALVAHGGLPLKNLLASAFIVSLLFCLYASAGLLVGSRFPGIRGTAAIGVASMFFFHIVFSICKVITKNPGSLAVRLLVPVCLFDRELAAGSGVIEWPFFLLWCVETALLLFCACRILERRDVVSG